MKEIEQLTKEFEITREIVQWLTENGVPFMHAMITVNLSYCQKIPLVQAFFTMQYEIQVQEEKKQEDTQKEIKKTQCC